MKWLLIFLLTSASSLFLPCKSVALTPDEYAAQVLKKDLPRSLRWFEKISEASSPNSFEVLDLYTSAMPAPQANHQSGISAKGAIERVLLLLEAAKLMSAVQQAPPEFQATRDQVMQVLQIAKDQTDHFKFGERPDVLFRQWQQAGGLDFPKFAEALERVLIEVQKLLATPPASASSSAENSQTEPAQTELVQTAVGGDSATFDVAENDPSQPVLPVPRDPLLSFEVQRFFAYVEPAEAGRVAEECEVAKAWATDQAPRCDQDDSLECDRKYARQCKKLH